MSRNPRIRKRTARETEAHIELTGVRVEQRKDEETGEDVTTISFPVVPVDSRPVGKALMEVGLEDAQIEEILGQVHRFSTFNALMSRHYSRQRRW
jgi:hypothetical protein